MLPTKKSPALHVGQDNTNPTTNKFTSKKSSQYGRA
jgi:hypothetical protein